MPCWPASVCLVGLFWPDSFSPRPMLAHFPSNNASPCRGILLVSLKMRLSHRQTRSLRRYSNHYKARSQGNHPSKYQVSSTVDRKHLPGKQAVKENPFSAYIIQNISLPAPPSILSIQRKCHHGSHGANPKANVHLTARNAKRHSKRYMPIPTVLTLPRSTPREDKPTSSPTRTQRRTLNRPDT